jgi:hypothetical protein
MPPALADFRQRHLRRQLFSLADAMMFRHAAISRHYFMPSILPPLLNDMKMLPP